MEMNNFVGIMNYAKNNFNDDKFMELLNNHQESLLLTETISSKSSGLSQEISKINLKPLTPEEMENDSHEYVEFLPKCKPQKSKEQKME